MEEFTIYYGTLPNGRRKIGVDSNYPNRIKKQKLTDHRVLEVHTCVYEVSDREQELQARNGLEVDNIPYHITYFKNKSPEHGAKISTALTGIPCLEETKIKIRETLTGSKQSEEHKRNISKGNKGISCLEETKIKISLKNKTTTPKLDLLVVQDRLLGMSQEKLAKKHNITRPIVRRIIKNMNQ